MPLLDEFSLKVVLNIVTTRTEAQIRSALVGLRPDVDVWLQQKADSDPQTTLVSTGYSLMVGLDIPQQQVYPKVSLLVNSTRDEDEIIADLDDFPAFLQGLLRPIIQGDPQTSILGWHSHFSTGSVDEVEP